MYRENPRKRESKTLNKIIHTLINEVLFPIKLIIPQPIVEKIPDLTTNKDIRIEMVLKRMPPNSKCLDIGCGSNELIEKYRSQGGEGLGVDVYDWGNVDLVVEDSAKLPFESKTFDCITFVASLNHIPNRIEVLQECYRILKDDGVLIVTSLTPRISLIWHKIAYWDRDQIERGMKEGEVYGFTNVEIRNIFKRANFTVLKKRKFSWGLNNVFIVSKV